MRQTEEEEEQKDDITKLPRKTFDHTNSTAGDGEAKECVQRGALRKSVFGKEGKIEEAKKSFSKTATNGLK